MSAQPVGVRLPVGRWGRLMIAAIVGFVVSVMWPSPARAQGPCWSSPVQLTVTLSTWDWFPDLTADSKGKVHVIWQAAQCSPKFEKPCLMHSQLQEGNHWLTYDLFVDQSPGQAAIRAAVVASADGWLHLVYLRDYEYIVYQRARLDNATSAGSWSEPRRLSGFEHAYFPDIAIDRQGILHVAWSESVERPSSDVCESGLCSDIMYRRSLDGGKVWSAPVNLSKSPVGTMKVHIRTDQWDRIHVFWEEGGDRWVGDKLVGGAYALSTDGGETWGAPVIFSYADGVPRQIVGEVDGRGQIIAVWRPVPGNLVMYQLSTDGLSWTAPQAIPSFFSEANTAIYDIYDAAIDSQGVVHLVAAGRAAMDGGQAIFHLEWDGQSWSAPEQISPYGDYPEFPRIAISGGNKLHVVWYVKQWPGYEEGQRMQVWYSECQTSAPALALQPEATPTPTIEVSPDLTAAAMPTLASIITTATPILTFAPGKSGLPDAASLYTENDEIGLLLLATAPVLVITTILLAVRLEWGKEVLRALTRRKR